MMTDTSSMQGGASVPDDGSLMRFIDGEASTAERSLIAAASPGSPPAARAWQLREASEAFTALLEDVPTPDLPPLTVRPAHGFEMRAAAVALLFITGTAVAMPGSRGALVDLAASALSWSRGPGETAAVTVAPSASVSFVPRGSEFTVEVESLQADGVIVFSAIDGLEVSAAAGPDVELVVLPNRLLVRNDPDSERDLRMRLPASVTSVRLRLGSGEWRTFERAALGDSQAAFLTVPLDRRR